DTKYAKIGVAICWDQWFPETARSLVLKGAELLFFPTAIGNEPAYPDIDSMPHWQNTQRGHAAANLCPVIASNRVGTEESKYIDDYRMTFYGSCFIADQHGEKVASKDRVSEGFITHTFDIDAINKERIAWGLFRDRRPEMYETILTSDGSF
ncbi:MAG: nitrilase-related carbon-nitrogen hydrolase, partial [Psittacicella sp.]